MDKLIVIGLETLAGGNVAAALAHRCEVVAVSRQRKLELEGCRTVRATSTAPRELADLVGQERPQWIVYCGATSASSWDWGPELDAGLEAGRVKAVEKAAAECGSRLTLVSTDVVFDDSRLFHREIFPTASTPVAAVARQVEEALSENDSLIIRTHLFGWSPLADSYAERVWSASLADGRAPEASGTRYASPILASDAAELLWQAYRRKLSGLYHLGGAERVSQWQFAVSLANAGGTLHEPRHLTAAAVEAISAAGQETSLDSRRLQGALSSRLPLVHEGIRRFVQQANNGYRQRLHDAASKRQKQLTAA